MAAYKPWTDKSYLYDKYVTKKMTIKQIAEECTVNGYAVTQMTIYNNLIKHGIPIRGGNRNLGKRKVGGNTKGKKGYYG